MKKWTKFLATTMTAGMLLAACGDNGTVEEEPGTEEELPEEDPAGEEEPGTEEPGGEGDPLEEDPADETEDEDVDG